MPRHLLDKRALRVVRGTEGTKGLLLLLPVEGYGEYLLLLPRADEGLDRLMPGNGAMLVDANARIAAPFDVESWHDMGDGGGN